MIYTSFDQVEGWIRDNGLTRWSFHLTNPNTRDGKPNDKIVDSTYYGDDLSEKIETTRRILEREGHCYGIGFHDKKQSSNSEGKEYLPVTGGMCCECNLSERQYMNPAAAAIASVPQPVDEQALASKIRKEIMAEIQAEKYEQDRKALDEEKREFEAEKNSAIGLMVGYLKPIISALAHKNVAGLDSQDDVRASRIQAVENRNDDVTDAQEDIFTDEEADRIYELIARFKKAEPQYMELIEAVVKMAESGDATYNMAKGVLLK